MEVVSRTAQPVVFVLLARFLSPADFGVVATASIAITFSQVFWDAGLSKALIQTSENADAAADVVFWTNVGFGLGIYCALASAAPWIAVFFKSTAAGPVLRVLALQVLLGSLGSVQQAILARGLNFRSLFWIRLATAFAPGLVSIPLAFLGRGVWALVAGSLAGQALNVALLWSESGWRPRLRFERQAARGLFGFGFWVVLEGAGAWLMTWGDNLVVGRFLGVHELGLYRTGSLLAGILFSLALSPVLPIMFPTFSRLQDDRAKLTAAFKTVNRIVIAIAAPMGIGLVLAGSEIAEAFFGPGWQGLGQVTRVMGLMTGVSWLVGLNGELYRAMGRPDVNTKLIWAQLLYYLPAYILASRFGLGAFVWARLSVAVVATPVHVFLCVKMLGVSRFYLWEQGRAAFVSAFVMGMAVLGVKALIGFLVLGPWVELASLVFTGVAAYWVAMWVVDQAFVLQIKRLATRALARSR